MPVVLLHGLGQSPDSWDAVVRELGTEALCPDLFALLRGAAAHYSNLFRRFAAYCEGLSGPLRLCGLSLGGVLALQYAAERPERVESLVLIGTPCAMPKRLLQFQNLLFRLMPEGAFRQMGLSRRDLTALTRSMLNLDFRADLGRIACPVLVLCGERDRANRKAARDLQAGLPRAELAWVPGAGHEVNVDAPRELSNIIKQFYN